MLNSLPGLIIDVESNSAAALLPLNSGCHLAKNMGGQASSHSGEAVDAPSPSETSPQPKPATTTQTTSTSTSSCSKPPCLDHTAYPHILDTVLRHAPPPSLLALRPTCRSLCARIDADLFAHLIFTRTETTTYIPTPTSLRPIERTDVIETARTVRGGLHAPLQDARLTHAQVLDAWGGHVPQDLLRALPGLRLLRTSVSAPLAPASRGRVGVSESAEDDAFVTAGGGGGGDGGESASLPRPTTLVRFFDIHDRRASFAWTAFGAPRTVFVIRFHPSYPGLLRHDVFDEAFLRSLDCPRFYVLLSPTAAVPGRDVLAARYDPAHPGHQGMLAEGGVLNVLARGVSEWRDHWRRDRRTGRPRQTFTFVGWETWESGWLSERFRRWWDSVPLHESEGGGGWWEEGTGGESSSGIGVPASGGEGSRGTGLGSTGAGAGGEAVGSTGEQGGHGVGPSPTDPVGRRPRGGRPRDIRDRFLRWVLFDTDDWGDEIRGVLRDSVEFMTLDEFRCEVGDERLFPLITEM